MDIRFCQPLAFSTVDSAPLSPPCSESPPRTERTLLSTTMLSVSSSSVCTIRRGSIPVLYLIFHSVGGMELFLSNRFSATVSTNTLTPSGLGLHLQ